MSMNLSGYQNTETISSQSLIGLRDKLRSLNLPVNVVQIYYGGGEHIAIVVPDKAFGRKQLRQFEIIEERIKKAGK